MKKNLLVCFFLLLMSSLELVPSSDLFAAEGFVRASGKKILDIHGNNLILRGIGTGNWVLQEGYMMESSAVAGTQWQFRNKLVQTIGEEKTSQFYEKWWDCHFRRVDVDSMAVWGFNCVRVAMHYKQFTLPVEEEPIAGKQTWLEAGFVRMDSLLQWCADNQMYLILDMHGAPGGQGKDANISDYDSSKSSLWESEANKQKLVDLWVKLAERYADSPWIGGYDLINEPNWELPNANKDLWDLFKRLTQAVRVVDKNHLIFLAGNSWGNDYNGLPALWDNNIALSFHKYWNNTDLNSLNFITSLRDQRNVPIWLGETGENSNTWFSDLVALCEQNNIGWSWWPIKKTGINNILRSKSNNDYKSLINSWKNQTQMNAVQAFVAVMQFAEDHKFENCVIQWDVIDALINRPHSIATRPFKNKTVPDVIFAADYDFGPSGEAYSDANDANYRLSTGTNVNWNEGWSYRNDGVDIEACNDNVSNGYSVGWIDDGEWLQYTLQSAEAKAYSILFRYAGQSEGKISILVNGKPASKSIDLPATGGMKTWSTKAISNVILPAGEVKIRIVFEKGNVNFNYFEFRAPKSPSEIGFEVLKSHTDLTKDELTLQFNKPVTAIDINSFSLKVNEQPLAVSEVKIKEDNSQEALLKVSHLLLNTDVIKLSCQAETCLSESQTITKFTDLPVDNRIAPIGIIPCRVEAENYLAKNGFSFEECQDVGGGQNSSYAAAGNHLDFFFALGGCRRV